jgi:PIN domain nuclease of toxin-antitoxin system
VTVLLDTHSFLWWVTDAPALSRRARKVIAESACLLSVASCWQFHHRDPFDRLIAAQARHEEIPLVTLDPVFTKYGVKRIW